ncbi:MAG: hypothetical protein TYPL_3190 [Candidatus Tyloplasma litorale]|nr:MAG: hypothetical protein TYPL_3190 [Mycoplasmatales bacterium]
MKINEDYLINEYKNFVKNRKIYFNYSDLNKKFTSSILKNTRDILNEYNTLFSYEKKGNKREGALIKKPFNEKLKEIKIYKKTIKVRFDADFESKAHVYFHELGHLVNNHEDNNKNEIKLSIPQKEYVAEVIAQALLFSFFDGMLVSQLKNNSKSNKEKYIENWIKNAKFSNSKIEEMWRQINFGYEKISKIIIKNSD